MSNLNLHRLAKVTRARGCVCVCVTYQTGSRQLAELRMRAQSSSCRNSNETSCRFAPGQRDTVAALYCGSCAYPACVYTYTYATRRAAALTSDSRALPRGLQLARRASVPPLDGWLFSRGHAQATHTPTHSYVSATRVADEPKTCVYYKCAWDFRGECPEGEATPEGIIKYSLENISGILCYSCGFQQPRFNSNIFR